MVWSYDNMAIRKVDSSVPSLLSLTQFVSGDIEIEFVIQNGEESK